MPKSEPGTPFEAIPYVGPVPFERRHQALFFGRTHESNELLALVTAHPVVLLYSQSGAGKTSLLNASLIPLLEAAEFEVGGPARVHGQIPEGFDAQKTNPYIYNALASLSEARVGSSRLEGMTLRDHLKEVFPTDKKGHLTQSCVLIFDQFEELFTLNPEWWKYRRGFFEQVAVALEDPFLRVVFAMREDYIAEMDPYESLLPEKLRTRFRMERLRKHSALTAIKSPLDVEPWKEMGREFAEGVAEKLVENLREIPSKTDQDGLPVKGEFVEPVQLQVVCQAIWNNLAESEKQITEDHLKKFGDINEALTTFYEECIREAIAAANAGTKPGEGELRESTLRAWFDSVLITETGKRGMVFRGERKTAGIPNAAIDKLEWSHIIRAELRDSERWYELSHDRFIQPIKESYKRWILELPGAERARLRLEERAAVWYAKRDAALLLDAGEVLEARRFESAGVTYTAPLLAYISASETAIQRVEGEKARELADARARELEQAQALAVEQERLRKMERERLEAEQLRIQAEHQRTEERAAAQQRDLEHQQRDLEQTQKFAQHQARAARRLRWLTIGVSTMFLFAIAAAYSAFASRSIAISSRNEAEKLTVNLKESLKTEQKLKVRAEELTESATEQRDRAIAAEDKAQKAMESERVAKENALNREKLANKRKQEADERYKAADREYRKAEQRLIEANEQAARQIAEAKQEAQLTRAEAAKSLAEANQRLADAEAKDKEKTQQLQIAISRAEVLNAGYLESQAKTEELAKTNQNLLLELGRLKGSSGVQGDGDTLFIRGLALESTKDLSGAAQSFQQALGLYRTKNDLSGQARAYAKLGDLSFLRSDYASAVEAYLGSVNAYGKVSDIEGKANSLVLVSKSLLAQARSAKSVTPDVVNQALLYYNQAVEAYQEEENKGGEASTLDSIGDAYLEIKNYPAAINSYSSARSIFDSLDNDKGEAQMYFMLGYAHQLKGNEAKAAGGLKAAEDSYEEAVENYENSLKIREQLGDAAGQIAACTNLAEVYLSLGDAEKAEKYVERAKSLQQQQGKQSKH
jgi:tetratricopeptide (TPR) repeat protein